MKLLTNFLTLSFLFVMSISLAQVSITQGNPNSSQCVGGSTITLDDIIITETAAADFSAGSYSFDLILPGEFEYVLPGSTLASSSGTDITIISDGFVNTNTYRINITVSATAFLGDQITISGLGVIAIGPSSLSDITFQDLGPNINGLNAAIASDLGSTTPPSAPTVTFTTPTICVGGTLTAPTTSGTSLQWYSDVTLSTPIATVDAANPTNAELGFDNSVANVTTVYVTQTVSGCESAATAVTSTVNANPVAAAGGDVLICDGEVAVIGGSPSATGGSGSYTYSWSPGTGLNNTLIANPTFTSSGASGPTVYTLTVTDGNTCQGTDNLNIEVTAVPTAPSVTFTTPTICVGGTLTAPTTTGTNPQWYSDAGLTTLLSTSASPTNAVLGFDNSLSNVTTVYVTQTVSGCESAATAVTSTVNALPNTGLTLSYDNTTICDGETITVTIQSSQSGINYQVLDNTLTPVGGLFAGTNGDLNITTSSLTTTQNSLTVRATNPVTGCTSDFTGQPITVNAIPAAPIPSNATLNYCQGDPTPSADFNVVGSNLEWYSDAALSVNIHSGVVSSPLADLGLDSSVPGVTTYYITQSNAGCESIYSTITVTVTAIPVVTQSPVDKTRCEGSNLTFQGNAIGAVSFQWQYNDGGGWLNADSGVDSEYSNETTSVLSIDNVPLAWNGYQYRLEITGSCGSPVYTGIATLTINSIPRITTQPSVPASVCEDIGVINLSITKSGTGTTTQWQVSINGGANWSNIVDDAIYSNSGTDNLTITNAPLGYNGYQYRAVVSGTCSPPVNSNAVTISVNENITVVTNPADVTECEGGAVFYSVGATGQNLSYQWYEDSGSGFVALTNNAQFSGVTTNTLNIASISSTMNGNLYRVTVTSAAPCSGLVNSVSASLTVNETPEVVNDPVPVIICEGNNTGFTVDVGVTTNPVIQWQVSTNNGSSYLDLSNDVTYSGVTTTTLSITGVTSSLNGNLYRVRVGGNCSPPVLSQAASLTITEVPEITMNPVDAITCEGENAIYSIQLGPTTNPVIQWQEYNGSTWNNLSNNATYSGVTTTSLTILTNSSINGFRYRAQVSGDCTPSVTSSDVLLTVREIPEIILQPEDSAVCAGTGVSFTVDAGSTTGVTYQWQLNTGSGWGNLADGGIYSGVNTNNLLISTTIVGMNNYLYRVIIGGVCTPSQTSFSARLNVYQVTVNQGSDFAICEGNVGVLGGTPTAMGGTGSYTYLWTGFDAATGYSSTVANPAITFLSAGSYRYNVYVEDAFGCNVTSGDIIVTVNAGNIVNASTDTTVCQGTSSITVQGAFFGGSVSNILWTIESGSGSLLNANTLTPTYQAPPAEFGTVTLKLTGSDASTCPDAVDYLDIDINRAAIVEAGSNAVICEGSAHILNGSISGSALSATWSTTGDGSFSFPGDLNATYTPGPNDIINGTVKVYLTTNDPDGVGNSGPCSPVKDSLSIVINQAPLVNAGSDITICAIDTAFLGGSFGGSAASITWSGGAGTFENINSINSYYIPSAAEKSAGSVILTITTNDPDGGGPCGPVNDNVTIFINTLPTVNAGSDQTICETSTASLSGSIGATATSATWTTSGNGTFNFSGDLNATYTPGSTDKSNNFAWLKLTTNDPSGPCPVVSDSLYLQVNTRAISTPGTYPPVCIGDTVFLSGAVSGSAVSGTWSGGIGVFGNVNQLNTYYVPDALESGTTVLLGLTTNDPSGPCSADFKQTLIVVNNLPLVEFFGLDNTYQENDPPITLTGFPDNTGVYSGPGIFPPNIFDPATAGAGTHDVVYTYTDMNGCENTRVRQTVVFPVENIVIKDPGVLCTNSSITNLSATPPGGVWTGPGVFIDTDGSYKINPGTLSSGIYALTYTYTDENNTVASKSINVGIYSKPIVDFTIGNFCVSDSIQFNDVSYMEENFFPNDSITQWAWEFGDQSEVSSLKSPLHKFATSKMYSVSLTVQTQPKCPKTIVAKSVAIGGVPDAGFLYSDIALGDQTSFTENSIFPDNGIGTIDQVSWDLGDGTTFSGPKTVYGTVQHIYADYGTYYINLTVESDLGCFDSSIDSVSIVPTIASYPYFQDFETASGWGIDGRNSFSPSWQLGTPNGNFIDRAHSGSNAWITSLSGPYRPDENSYINTPSFDLRPLKRPMMSLATWSNTSNGFDGAVIQYSLDGGANWQDLGNSDEEYGINWYNEKGILGNPGGSFNQGNHGWSGEDTTYRISRRHLDDLADIWTFGTGAMDLSQVRFRIAFGSIADIPADLDGFAFDDFFIGERTRNVLIENFTNLNNSNAINSNLTLYDLLVESPFPGNDGLLLQYHLNYPTPDQIYGDNPFPPDARGAIYELTSVPVVIMDGMRRFSYPSGAIKISDLINRSLNDPLFEITADFTATGNDYDVQINYEVTPLDTAIGEVVVHIVPIEKVVAAGNVSGSSSDLLHIVKDMVPSESGTVIVNPVLGTPYSGTMTWDVGDMTIYDNTQLAAVVFVQKSGNSTDKRVLQSQIIDLPPLVGRITGLEDEGLVENVVLYPNPVKESLNISFENTINSDTEWKLIDQKGVVIERGRFNAGLNQYSISTIKVPNGMYILQMTNQDEINVMKKVIVLK